MKRILGSLIILSAILFFSGQVAMAADYPDNEVLHADGWVQGKSQNWMINDGDGIPFVWMKTTTFSHANKAFGKGTLEIFGKLEIVMFAILNSDGHFLSVWYRVGGHTFVAARFNYRALTDPAGNVIGVLISFEDAAGGTVYRVGFVRSGVSQRQEQQKPKSPPRDDGDTEQQFQGP